MAQSQIAQCVNWLVLIYLFPNLTAAVSVIFLRFMTNRSKLTQFTVVSFPPSNYMNSAKPISTRKLDI